MTPEAMGAVTLAELEAMAERLGKAVSTIREAQSLLGPGSAAAPFVVGPPEGPLSPGGVIITDPAAAHRMRQFQAVETRQPRSLQTDPRAQLTAADRLEKERLIRARPVDTNLPPEIAAMENS